MSKEEELKNSSKGESKSQTNQPTPIQKNLKKCILSDDYLVYKLLKKAETQPNLPSTLNFIKEPEVDCIYALKFEKGISDDEKSKIFHNTPTGLGDIGYGRGSSYEMWVTVKNPKRKNVKKRSRKPPNFKVKHIVKWKNPKVSRFPHLKVYLYTLVTEKPKNKSNKMKFEENTCVLVHLYKGKVRVKTGGKYKVVSQFDENDSIDFVSNLNISDNKENNENDSGEKTEKSLKEFVVQVNEMINQCRKGKSTFYDIAKCFSVKQKEITDYLMNKPETMFWNNIKEKRDKEERKLQHEILKICEELVKKVEKSDEEFDKKVKKFENLKICVELMHIEKLKCFIEQKIAVLKEGPKVKRFKLLQQNGLNNTIKLYAEFKEFKEEDKTIGVFSITKEGDNLQGLKKKNIYKGAMIEWPMKRSKPDNDTIEKRKSKKRKVDK